MVIGKATPKPKYKAGQDAKKAQEKIKSESTGSSKPIAQTGTGNIGSSFQTEGGRIGFAGAGVTQIKEGGAEKQGSTVIYSTTYKGGSGKIHTAEGKTVDIKQTATPANVQKEREKILKTTPSNQLTTNQQKDLQAVRQKEANKQQRKIERETRAEEIQRLADQGYKFQSLSSVNGKLVADFQKPNTETPEKTYGFSPPPVLEVTDFKAPKQFNASETQPESRPYTFSSPIPEKKDLNSYGGQINANTFAPDSRTTINKVRDFFIEKQAVIEGNYIQNSNIQTFANPLLAEVFVFSAGKTAIEIGQGFREITINAPNPLKKPGSFLLYGAKTAGDIVQGTADQVVRIEETIITANPLEFSREAGAVVAQVGIGEGIGKVSSRVKSTVKGAFVDYGKAQKWYETQPELDAGYTFNPESKYNLVPPEYTELGNIATVKPKPGEVLTPDETIPGTYLEIAQSLAKGDNKVTSPGVFSKDIPELQTTLVNERPFQARSIDPAQNIGQVLNDITKSGESQKVIGEFGFTKVVNTPEGKALVTTKGELVYLAPDKVKGGFKLFGNKKAQSQIQVNVFEEGNRFIDEYKTKYATYKARSEGGLNPDLNPPSGNRLVIPLNIGYKSLETGAIAKITTFPTLLSQSNSQGIGNTVKYEITQKQGVSSSLNQGLKERLIQSQGLGLTQSQSQAQSSTLTQAQAFTLVQSQSQATTQKQSQKQAQQQKTSFKPFPKIIKEKETKNKPYNSFITEVRSKGTFKTISTSKTLPGAIDTGLKKVRNTASASIRIRQANTGEIIETSYIPSDFSKSTKEKGVFIQKIGRRIGTPGEKSEITFKGIANNRFKKGGTKWGF